jgi:hypothetical protein
VGFAPPVSAPAPPSQASLSSGAGVDLDGGLADDPSASSICGFTFPPFIFFKFGFHLPFIGFPPSLPIPHIGLSINCDLSNPLSVNTSVTWGGGRAPNGYPDPDALEQGS